MRLIDADALQKEYMYEHGGKRLMLIDVAPTIEERKTGRWIHDGFAHPHGVDWCHCSICGNRESVNSVYTQVDIYPYCPSCGAKMGTSHE